MGVFDQRNGERNQFGDVLGGLHHFCGVDVVAFARDDGFVGGAGGYVFCYAGVEL